MPRTPRTKKRHPLRKKDAGGYLDILAGLYGPDELEMIDPRGMEYLETDMFVLILHAGIPVLVIRDGIAFPALRHILERPPSSAWVSVDMGAVPHVINGADVMAPGVRDAHPGIMVDSVVWIRDLQHSKPLAVGLALMDAAAMISSEKGKAVKTLHFVGDPVWEHRP